MPGPAARARKQALGHVLRSARHVVAAGGVPGRRGRARGRAVAADHGRAARASTSSASGRSTPPSGRAARRHFGLPVDAELVVGDLPARAAQGLRHRDPRPRRRSRRTPARPACWRSPAAAATSGGCARLAAELRRAGAVPRPRRQRRPAARCTAAPTCSRCCAATGGAGSSRRGSASCSSRPRRAACRRSPATAGARPRPSPTARPGIVVRRPDDVRRGRPTRSTRCSTTTPARGAMGAAARAAGRGRVLLRRARRAARPRRSGVLSDARDAEPDRRARRRRRHRPRRPRPAPRSFGVTAALRRGRVLHGRAQWVGGDHGAGAVRDRRVRLPVVVLQRRPAQPHRRDLGQPAVPAARAGDPDAGAAHDARRCSASRW